MSGTYLGLLRHRGFASLLVTIFLGAINDNFYKIVVSLIAADLMLSQGGIDYLALSGALFVLPYLLFSGYAGWLADVVNKRTVLIVTKSFEILAMLAALLALRSGDLDLMMGVIFLTALQSAFFSPAHYGILPEMLPDRELSRANGLDELATFLAIILGTAGGSVLYGLWGGHIEWVALALIAIAVLGSLASLGIGRVPPPAAHRPFPLNPWGEVIHGLKLLFRQRPLWLTVLGISYFWFLGALLQLGIIRFGKEVLALGDSRIGFLQAAIAVGVGLGSIAAGRLSGDKVELGLVPLGSIGIGISCLLLAASPPSYSFALVSLVLLGFSAGLFIVPLNTFLQQRAGAQERGRLIATNNFLNMLGVALASGVLWLLGTQFGLRADRVVLVVGLFTFAVTAYVLWLLPEFVIRLSLWLLAHSLYRIRLIGSENLPARGPALLVCNHLSFVDGLLVGASTQRFVRFLMHRSYYAMRGFSWLFRLMKAIPIAGESPKRVAAAFEQARAELAAGHVVCIFAEGAISRSGNPLPFRRGFERILEGLDVPVIPVHLDRVWGSIFSFKDGRFLWKWPRRVPLPVTVSVGQPLPATTTAWQARQAILELGADAFEHRRKRNDLLHLRFLKTAKRRWFTRAVADSSGRELSFGKLLIGSLALAGWLRRHRPDDRMVGVLLPASVAGVLANVALLCAGKVAVNLNFTAGAEAMATAARQCAMTTIITSRQFLAKAKLEEPAGALYVEDVIEAVPAARRAPLALACFLLPTAAIARLFDLKRQRPDDSACVLFSSGSTGAPKGVVLSHNNILSNIEAVAQVLWLARDDRVMGVLPFFHAFGLTGTLWLPLVCGIGAVYHPNPLDAKTIGKLVAKHRATALITTPTFCQAYLRSCEAADFASLRHVVVGAEKLQPALTAAFQEKFGLTLLEGYGCTEMGPVIAVNRHDVADGAVRQQGHKPGTVGHPIPGVAARLVDPETGEALPADREGLLLVKGPSRMLGYLNDPGRTAAALRDGWYVTGDIAAIGNDGFIRITDRLARFSKIGGEMVPHGRIEEIMSGLAGVGACVVTAVADAQKGERLVAFYTAADGVSPDGLWQGLSASGLPKLWLPKPQNIYRLEALPTLATGKVDLRRVKQLAQEQVAGDGV
jgi:acyl-[acyl-carrier-protein]-phospholipid O-acyltransferase/long-chain-fatty-acid--[acyl-carrier-protein] ligase